MTTEAEAGLGENRERSTADTTDALLRFSPPTLEQHLDAARREGFFEFSYRALERRTASLWKELKQARHALALEKDNVREAEIQMGEWRDLAIQYGTETTAEKQRRENKLRGNITIAHELALQGDEAIMQSCLCLARKLIAATKGPSGETS